MVTRSRKPNNDPPNLADLEGAANPETVPGFMPPPGTEGVFENKVRYTRIIQPDEATYSEELRALAGEEIEDNTIPAPEIPLDPLSEFCLTWRNFAGYLMRVTRLPDPFNKRAPGQSYNNSCLEITAFGSIPFDPNSLVPTLQSANGNSGGVFRLFLTDEAGQLIPGARLDRVLIPDPPKQNNRNREFDPYLINEYAPPYYQKREPQPTSTPPPKSETELYIEQMQRELFQKVMMRALDPPTPPPIDPLSTIPEGDRLALSLLRQGDLLPNLVERISSLTQAPDRMENATWKDKGMDAVIQLVTHNPQIVATVTDIISRATVALATAFAPRSAQASQVFNEPIPVTQHTPAQRIPPPQLPYSGGRVEPLAPHAVNGLPETPQPEDEELDNVEDAEIDMVEDIVKLLLSEKPLSLDDPIILDIRDAYPTLFNQVMAGIATMPSATLIQYVCAKSDFCADLFNSQRNGPYLRQRLEELKVLLNQNAPQGNTEETTATTEAPTS